MTAQGNGTAAGSEDVTRVLGQLDEAILLEILKLRPTTLDLEEAVMWLSGDADIFGASRPLRPVAGAIVEILTADQNEEPPRPQ